MNQKNLNTLSRLNSCADDLNSLGPDTEPEFLNIGDALHKLAEICFGMTDDATQLISLSSFRVEEETSQEGDFVEETRVIFNEVAEHVGQTINSLNEGDHLLVDILTEVKKLKKPIRELHSIGKTFRVLGISIKVESSRNENSRHGFQLLAEEVASIAKLVHENCRYCNDKANGVTEDINASRQMLSSKDNTYDEGGEQAIFNILNALEEVGGKSEILASGIKERSAVMVQGISDVVMAMQFHDISRQQLENVAKALTEAWGKVQSVTDSSSDEKKDQVAMEVYGILSIQVAHLNSIYEQILSARNQIKTGLGKTMEEARQQAKDAGMLLAMDEQSGNQSVVAHLEEEIDNIVLSLNKSLGVVKDAAEVSRGVYDNVSKIGKFVNTIEGIAFDVKILAINAMVEAIKTGDTGRTLTVLAKELSALSQETRDEANSSIQTLQNIMGRTEKQLQFSADLDQNRAVIDTMIEKAKLLTATILTAMQDLSTVAHAIDNANRSLASQINQLVPGIQFPVVMGDRIARNWQILCEIIELIEEEHPQFLEKNSAVEQMMKKLAQQYVMDRERSIHAQVSGGEVHDDDTDFGDVDLFEDDGFELFDNDIDQAQQTEDKKEKNEEFGDNVELF